MLNPESGEKLSKRDRDRRIRKRAQEWMRTSKRTTGELSAASGIGEQRLVDWINTDTIQLDLTEQPKVMAAVGLKEVDLPEVMIHDFRKNGYAPELLLNFLSLQGWSPGGDLEEMTIDQMIEKFSIDRLISSNPKFNREKLKAFSTNFYGNATMERQLLALRDWLSVHPESLLRDARDEELVMLLKMNRGYKLMSDIDEKSSFFFVADDSLVYDPKSVEKILKKDEGQGYRTLKSIRDIFAAVTEWTPAMIEAAVTEYVNTSGLALGKVAQPLRLAVSGTSVSPPIFDTLAFLGQRRALIRIDRCLNICG